MTNSFSVQEILKSNNFPLLHYTKFVKRDYISYRVNQIFRKSGLEQFILEVEHIFVEPNKRICIIIRHFTGEFDTKKFAYKLLIERYREYIEITGDILASHVSRAVFTIEKRD